tara:strand:+ start:658 stop:1413 length:756 start_codon:yes stop_codon:yes gene_type:complete
MLKIRIIPLIQLLGSSVVKTIKFSNPRVVGDAISTVKIFNKRMADEMIIVDIGASKNKKINYNYLKRLSKECIMPLALGGGIHSESDVIKMFENGADKIVINSMFFDDVNLLKKIILKFGSQSVVFSLDLRKENNKYKIFSNSINSKSSKLSVKNVLKKVSDIGIGEILFNSVDRDGTMLGYDYKLLKLISNEVKVPIIAAGGCGKSEDCVLAIKSGANAVSAGSIFYWVGESILSVKKIMYKKDLNVRLL